MISLVLNEDQAHALRAAALHTLVWRYLTPEERHDLHDIKALLEGALRGAA